MTNQYGKALKVLRESFLNNYAKVHKPVCGCLFGIQEMTQRAMFIRC